MENLIFHMIAAQGLLFVLKDSTILKKPRDFAKSLHPLLNELLSCAQCLGFWTGCIYAASYYVFFGLTWSMFFMIPAFGFAISITGLLVNLLLDLLDELVFKLRGGK